MAKQGDGRGWPLSDTFCSGLKTLTGQKRGNPGSLSDGGVSRVVSIRT